MTADILLDITSLCARFRFQTPEAIIVQTIHILYEI